MKFMIISNPLPGRTSDLRQRQAAYWEWIEPLQASGVIEALYVKAGRGVIVVANVENHEMLHRLTAEWSEHIPASFDFFALVDTDYQMSLVRAAVAPAPTEPK